MSSLSDWMSDADYEWRQRLQPVNLVIEADFSAEEVREAQAKFGTAASQLLRKGASYKQILKRYPGLTLMILVGHASIAYVEGAYWESFWAELGMPRDPDFEKEIRKSFRDLLDKFSLARFPDLESGGPYKFVMMCALHAGIPVYCLPDLLELIRVHISHGRVATGAALLEWLQEPGKEYRTAALDKPVRNFLEHGAEFAIDILDRVIEFIEATSDEPTLLDQPLESATTGLPTVMLDELIRQLKDSPPRVSSGGFKASGARRPSINYLADDDEIVLVIPVADADLDAPFRISFDGDVREIHASRRWGGGVDTAAARIAVPGPVREVIISRTGQAAESLPLVLQSDPLLIFDRDGRRLGRQDLLKDCIWAVFPDDHELIEVATRKPIRYEDSGAPAGWHGWRSAFVELEGVESLQLLRDGTPAGTSRRVLRSARPYFETGPSVAGVVAPDGRTVYSERPWVILPAGSATPPPMWNVRVRRYGDTEWIVNETWLGGVAETCVDPFDDAEGPQLGLFEVFASGPIGSDVRFVFFLAEGLQTRFQPTVRVPMSGGLTPCTASIDGGDLTITPDESLTLGPHDLELTIGVSNGNNFAELLLTPPHVEIRSGEAGQPAAWRMTPTTTDPDDFAQDRFVAVRAPGVDKVDFEYVSAQGDLLQVDPKPRRRHGNVHESKTQQFADTVRAHPAGRIVATLHTAAGPVRVTVLSAQPRRLASGVKLVSGTLEFDDVANVEDLAAYIWVTTAPWCPAEVVPIREGKAVLPEHLIDRGDLRCQLFVDDPWVYVEPPDRPGADCFAIEQPGWCAGGTPQQVKISRYLGTQDRPPVDVGAIPEVWIALARLHADGDRERFTGLIQLLEREPRKALECLGDSTMPASDKMAMLIRSELVNRSFQSKETLNELHTHPWFGCMVEIADLPSLYNRRDEVSAERSETLAYLRDRGGEPLIELLSSGKTSAFRRSCIDSSVLEMSFRPGRLVEAKLHEIQQVPHPALHPDNLRAGVYEALCHRSKWTTSGWSANFAEQTSFMVKPIRRASLLAHEMIATRSELLKTVDVSSHPWMLMSVQSLTLALAARLEAYKRIDGRYLNRGLLGDWARLAQLCPTMVANDLLIAEAALLYDRRGNLIGDD